MLPLILVTLLDPAPAFAQGKGKGKGKGPTTSGNGNGPGNAKGKGKPAKISWDGCRLTMSDFEETGGDGDTQLTAELSFTSNMHVESAQLWVSSSLGGVFDFEPETFGAGDIVKDEPVPITVTLTTTPCDEGHTLGGTVHLWSGGRTLARPCPVSLKRDACEEDGEGPLEPGEPEPEDLDEEEDDDAPITWQVGAEGEEEELEELTEEQFNEEGKATVSFCSAIALEGVNIVPTPSLSECLMLFAPPATEFPLMVGEGECVELTFMLTPEELASEDTCGGTVHVRNAGRPPKTFAEPLSVNLFDDEEQQAEVVPSAIVSSASYADEPVAPGQIVSIFGLGLGSEELAVFDLNEDGEVDENLAGTLVLFDGIPAPLLSTYRGQINTIVPMAVQGDDVELRVLYLGKQSAPFPVPVGLAAPALFTLDGTGRGQAAAINPDGTLNTNSNAARRGRVIQLFGTGGGLTDIVLGDGEIVGETVPQLVSPVTVLIGGEEGDVQFAGAAPGLVNGVVQFNVRIPSGIKAGPKEVIVIIDGVQSGGDVTIAVW